MRLALALALAFGPWAFAGCGNAQDTDPVRTEVSAPEEDPGLVAMEQAELVLYVSNQSFVDNQVRLTVAIDGITVSEEDFHVEGQHNWIQFLLDLTPGAHEVTATSDSGATLRQSFEISGDKPRFALIEYWVVSDSAELTWLFQRDPLYFA